MPGISVNHGSRPRASGLNRGSAACHREEGRVTGCLQSELLPRLCHTACSPSSRHEARLGGTPEGDPYSSEPGVCRLCLAEGFWPFFKAERPRTAAGVDGGGEKRPRLVASVAGRTCVTPNDPGSAKGSCLFHESGVLRGHFCCLGLRVMEVSSLKGTERGILVRTC